MNGFSGRAGFGCRGLQNAKIRQKKVGSSGTDPMKMLLLSQVEETASKKLDTAKAEFSIPRCSTRHCIKVYSFFVIYLQNFMLGL
jgi:hypothetical protein